MGTLGIMVTVNSVPYFSLKRNLFDVCLFSLLLGRNFEQLLQICFSKRVEDGFFLLPVRKSFLVQQLSRGELLSVLSLPSLNEDSLQL